MLGPQISRSKSGHAVVEAHTQHFVDGQVMMGFLLERA